MQAKAGVDAVADWKRIVVGDAFRLPSRDPNYYRDLFLLWPFILFTIAGLANMFGAGSDHRLALKCAILSFITLLLARERLVLIGGALGFYAVGSGISFVLKHDPIALAVSMVAGVLCLLLIRAFKSYKMSYEMPKGLSIVGTLTGMISLGISLGLLAWIRR